MTAIFDELKESAKPMMDWANLNALTMEKLLRSQVAFTTECMEAGFKQAESMATIKDFSALLEAQKEFTGVIGDRLMNMAKENTETVAQFQEELTKMMASAVNYPVKAAKSGAATAAAKKAA